MENEFPFGTLTLTLTLTLKLRDVPTRKTGLPFQNFRLSREFSSGTNQGTFTIYIPTGISGNLWLMENNPGFRQTRKKYPKLEHVIFVEQKGEVVTSRCHGSEISG